MVLTPPKPEGIRFKGEDITGQEPYLLARKGIGYVPDDRRIFADLPVGENLEIAARSSEPFDYAQDKHGALVAAIGVHDVQFPFPIPIGE